MGRWLAVLAGVVSLALAFAGSALAAPGDLDPSFGTGGRAILTPSGRQAAYNDVAIQPDGKIVLAGYSVAPEGDTDMTVTRLNANGTPDMDFGTDGTAFINVIAPPFTRSDDLANAVALLPGGKILVAGTSSGPNVVTVARLGAGGTLDTSFSAGGSDPDGIWRGPLGYANDIGVAADGKITVAGTWTRFGATQSDYRTERLNANGSPDNTYGDAGSYGFTSDLGGSDGISRLAVLPDGKVLLAGYVTGADSDAVVARIAPGTGLDTGFGDNGKRVYSAGAGADDAAQDLVVEPGGKIDVAGYTGTNFTLTRLTAGGGLDPSLDGKSTVEADFGSDDDADAIALLANGKVVLSGTSGTAFAVARFQPGGLPDTSFGSGGKRTINFPGTNATAYGMAVQPDGKIVIAGYVGTAAASGAVVRLQGDTAGEGGGGAGGGGKAKVYRCAGKRATIVGTNKKNRLKGTKRADVIVGLGGNDKISGLGGNDIVCGGSGNDKVSGGKGNDRLYGDAGNDSVSGDQGNDRESGGSGNDKVSGGPGKDKLAGNAGKDKLNGGPGKDKCAGHDRKKSC
jgi:uncharacterized delta-60 repeat protein